MEQARLKLNQRKNLTFCDLLNQTPRFSSSSYLTITVPVLFLFQDLSRSLPAVRNIVLLCKLDANYFFLAKKPQEHLEEDFFGFGFIHPSGVKYRFLINSLKLRRWFERLPQPWNSIFPPSVTYCSSKLVESERALFHLLPFGLMSVNSVFNFPTSDAWKSELPPNTHPAGKNTYAPCVTSHNGTRGGLKAG